MTTRVSGGGGSYQRGLRISIDSGRSWDPATLTDSIAITGIALSAKHDLLFASAWETGLWQSRDGGKVWQHIPGELRTQAITNCRQRHPIDHVRIVAPSVSALDRQPDYRSSYHANDQPLVNFRARLL
jgi:hypothetical protein